jgi:hypothetical protein
LGAGRANRFWGINLQGEIKNFQALKSTRLTISLSDVVAERRPLAWTELPYHPNVQEIKVFPGQHGWLIADKELQ